MVSKDKVLGVGESTPYMVLVGQCDVSVSGLTSGSVKLEYMFPKTDELTDPQWTDFPDGSFSVDTYKTIFISEHGVKFRLTGVGNNAGVYARLGRYLNK